MAKSDRRVQRTREMLQTALVDLLRKHPYESITVQEIVDRANIGRTTFYQHFNSKDELFVSCHESIISAFHFGPLFAFSREELLSSALPPGMVSAYHHLEEARMMLLPVFQGENGPLILRQIRASSAQDIEASLRAIFPEADSNVPLDVLANFLAGAQLTLVHWWLENRQPISPEALAQSFHRLQRAAINDAFGFNGN